MKIAQPVPRRRSALLSLAVIATSSAGVEESRSGPRNFAVRWNEPSLLRMTPSRTSAAQGRKSARLCERRRYSARFIMDSASADEVLRIAEMAAHHIDKGRVPLGGPHCCEMRDKPDRAADDPETQAQADRRGERDVDDRDRPRRAAEQDRLGQSAMDRRIEPGDGVCLIHQTRTPPPNWKKVRKKLDAAKAIERPKTIWISRRKPPEVSPKASVRPVMTMMITEMTLATGPWTDSRIWLSGCSQGIEEPAA